MEGEFGCRAGKKKSLANMLNQLNSVDLSVIEQEREDAIVVEMRNTLKMPPRAWKVDGCERQQVVQQVGEQAASGLGELNTQVGKQAASGFGEREEQAAGMKNVENGEEAPDELSEQVADASGGVGGVPIPSIHDGETVSDGGTASGQGDLGSGLVQREELQPQEIEDMVERQHPEDTADAFGKPVFTVGPTGLESWVPVTPPPLSNAPSFEDSKIPKVSSASGQVRPLDDEPDQVLDNLSSLVVPDEAFGQLQEFGVDAGKVVAEAQATPTISPLASASAASGQGPELDVAVDQVLAGEQVPAKFSPLALPRAASGQVELDSEKNSAAASAEGNQCAAASAGTNSNRRMVDVLRNKAYLAERKMCLEQAKKEEDKEKAQEAKQAKAKSKAEAKQAAAKAKAEAKAEGKAKAGGKDHAAKRPRMNA